MVNDASASSWSIAQLNTPHCPARLFFADSITVFTARIVSS